MALLRWASRGLALTGIASAQYLLGVGIGDVTGPVVETNMMGYADLSQTDTGLHMRQRSRAFIVAEESNPANRIVLINSDIAMGDNGVRREIIAKLEQLYPGVYSDQNVGLTGTHAHSGVGGYLENLLPQLTSLGFVKETFDAVVQGTVAAVVRAHEDLQPGSLSFGTTQIPNGNINRSPYAYLANPVAERNRYQYDQDKDMQLIKFVAADGTEKGFVSFYAVHGTSLYQNNTLVSGDNKGYAAYLYESFVEPNSAPGNTSFVAGFLQANVGDTSPNTGGAFCFAPGKSYDGQPCTFEYSLCGNKSQECHGIGPAFPKSDFDSNTLIGQYQFEGAQRIMQSGVLTTVTGSVRSVHSFISMDNYTFTLANGTTARTCKPAMGYSFAGGTTDGPGFADFYQGETSTNPFWELVKGAVSPLPSADQKACHAPKPILLNTGEATTPYDWSPHTVNVQMFRIGQIIILLVPGEFTTMAGRRIREAIQAKAVSAGIIDEDAIVLLTGPANTYGHYVTTREEYGIQRYEGGSTIFGPATLEAYTVIYGDRLQYLADDVTGVPDPGTPPPNLESEALSLRTGVVQDSAPIGKNFGDVLTAPNATYTKGSRVTVKFQAAVPRNNLRLDQTFLTVELRDASNKFNVYRTDSHPSTRYNWLRTNGLLGYSEVTITWDIESNAPSGTYRISYFGDWKNGWTGAITPFSSTSPTFTVS
ncbi:Neutral/alkaline nonlysosomal ceramidase [Atractiella rhizophila]|nr:Neutral/alkaline nonlysosomal ceramidase [Atractiella rhizophila]